MSVVRIVAIVSLGVIRAGPALAQSLSSYRAYALADARVTEEKARATNKVAFKP